MSNLISAGIFRLFHSAAFRVFGFEALWLILPTAAGWLVFKGEDIR